MENRMISLERNTNETQIDLTLDLDGSGPVSYTHLDVYKRQNLPWQSTPVTSAWA